MIVNIMLTSAVRDLLVDLAVILLNFLFPGFWISLLVFCFFYYYLVTGLWTVVNLMLATRDCLTHCCRQFTRVGQPSALLQNGRGRRRPLVPPVSREPSGDHHHLPTLNRTEAIRSSQPVRRGSESNATPAVQAVAAAIPAPSRPPALVGTIQCNRHRRRIEQKRRQMSSLVLGGGGGGELVKYLATE